MISCLKRKTRVKDDRHIQEQDPKANILTQEGCFIMRNFIVCTFHLMQLLIKSRVLRWAGHEAKMGEGRSPYKINR